MFSRSTSRHGQFHRPVVFDDDDAAGDGRLAIGEGVQRIHQFFRVHARRAFDLDLHVLRREIVDGFDLELALARGVFDGGDQRIGRGGRRNFLDDHGGFVLDFDVGADFDRAFAVLVIARVHQAAGRKIRQALERLFFENGDLRFEQFGKIVRQNPRAQADGDAFRAEHEHERQLAGQRDRLLVAAVVAGNKIGDFVVEKFRARQFGQAAFDVTRGGGRVAGENIAEISLAFDEITFVGQHHQRVADGRVAVRMILHRVADDIGDFDEPPVVLLVQRPEDAPLHRLEAVREIGNRAVADDIAGVIQKPAIHARVQAAARLFWIKRLVDDGLDRFGDDMIRAVAIGLGGFRFHRRGLAARLRWAIQADRNFFYVWLT